MHTLIIKVCFFTEGRITSGLAVEVRHRGPLLILESPPPYYSFDSPLPFERQPRLNFPPMSPNVYPGIAPSVDKLPPQYYQKLQHPYYQQQHLPPPSGQRVSNMGQIQYFPPPRPAQLLQPPPPPPYPHPPYRDILSEYVKRSRLVQEPMQLFSPHYLHNETDSM